LGKVVLGEISCSLFFKVWIDDGQNGVATSAVTSVVAIANRDPQSRTKMVKIDATNLQLYDEEANKMSGKDFFFILR